MKRKLKIAGSILVIALSLCFFIYPAIVIVVVTLDSELKTTGQTRLVPRWFEAAAGRFESWATGYLETDYAESLHHDDVAPTEWPMFGAVFFLVAANDLQRQGRIDVREGKMRDAVEKAVAIVMSPVTATWVRTKWGDDYLERENVFYRMLLILGLASYEQLTGNTRHRETMSAQRSSLARELAAAKFHLLDDYPGECYPNDLLWAVAAIQRAAKLEGTNHNGLASGLMAAFDAPPVKGPENLPAFQMHAQTGMLLQGARGCGNSGILQFAAELDADVAGRWYGAHASQFWKHNGWLAGFTELPRGTRERFADVDSGPVLWEFGSVASAFGIGAAKTVGRVDHAAPLVMEAVACSWPTPFGLLIPGLMGYGAADSWPLGEVALLFSMTRPTYVTAIVPFESRAPAIVWVLALAYGLIGGRFIWVESRYCWRACRRDAATRA